MPSLANVSYDANGRCASMTDGTGTSSYTYDSLGRLTQSQDGAGKSVSYDYDLAGSLTMLTYPDNTSVTRSYDAADRITGITDWLQNTTSFGYDANNNLVTQNYPNSVAATFTYNHADRLTQIADTNGGNPLWTFGYGRSNLGQVSSAADPIDSSSHTYSYDPLNRLTGDQAGGTSSTNWSYNAADQLTGITGSAIPATTMTYDAAGELNTLTQGTSPSFTKNLSLTYNANGDRTGQTDNVGNTSANYGYDQADRLTNYTSGSTTASYTYNGDGLRISKSMNGTSTSQVWDLAEGLPVLVHDGSTKYVCGPSGLPLEQVDGSGTVLYFIQDQLGSTRALLDGSGATIATFTYDAYGTLTSSTGTITTPFGYGGQYTDAESGLQYLRSRYYDPQTGQFMTADPLVAQTGQAYSYTGDNPVNRADPSGLCTIVFFHAPVRGDEDCLGDAAHITLDIATLFPYAIYYASYNVMDRANSWGSRHGILASGAVHVATAPLIVPEAIGLGEDAGIDWIKGHTVNKEMICDEGVTGYINPLHAYLPGPLKGPRTYLPGIHSNGTVDWQW